MNDELFEAPACITFRFITEKGWEGQFTLRGFDEDELIVRFGKLVNELEDKRCRPTGYSKPKQPDIVIQQINEELGFPPEEPPAPPIVETPTPAQPATTETGTFQAESLVGNVNEGRVFWKVKGGPFSKYGVTIWPEVLSGAGFDASKLDPMMHYDLKGYIASYIEKDGKPSKVVKLAKAISS